MENTKFEKLSSRSLSEEIKSSLSKGLVPKSASGHYKGKDYTVWLINGLRIKTTLSVQTILTHYKDLEIVTFKNTETGKSWDSICEKFKETITEYADAFVM